MDKMLFSLFVCFPGLGLATISGFLQKLLAPPKGITPYYHAKCRRLSPWMHCSYWKVSAVDGGCLNSPAVPHPDCPLVTQSLMASSNLPLLCFSGHSCSEKCILFDLTLQTNVTDGAACCFYEAAPPI